MAKPDYPEILRTQIDSEDELNLFSEKLSALYDYYEVRSEKTGLIDWRELALNLAMKLGCQLDNYAVSLTESEAGSRGKQRLQRQAVARFVK